MNRLVLLLLFVGTITHSFSFAQVKESKIKLPIELKEISGLEKLTDSILIAINDGGNEPLIYFFDLNGKIIKKTTVSGAINSDWEDLTMDNKGNLYIADAGNNLNQRRNLAVLKVNANKAFLSDSIEAEIIQFNYSDQTNFNLDPSHRIYDCEAIFWKDDSLHVLTKNTSKSSKNNQLNCSFEYLFPDQQGEYVAKKKQAYWTGGSNQLKHQVTGCDLEGNSLFILTYGFLLIQELQTQQAIRKPIHFNRLTQKEAIVVLSENKTMIAAEKHPILGGPYLYTITWK